MNKAINRATSVLIFLMMTNISLAQSPESMFSLKEGMKLHYKINDQEDLKIILNKLSDVVNFTWYKGDVKGFDITLTANAMKTAEAQLNHIFAMTGMPPQKYEHATSVFISRQMFDELEKGEVFTCYPYADGYHIPVNIAKLEDDTYQVKNISSGETIELPMIVVKGENEEIFHILNDANFPLILHQYLDFKISLVGIEE